MDESWTYVEVSRADESEAQRELDGKVQQIRSAVENVDLPYCVEVRIERDLTDADVATMTDAVVRCLRRGDRGEVQLPDTLGRIFVSDDDPYNVIFQDRGDPDPRPTIMRVNVLDDPPRQVLVRAVFTDERWSRLLKREARQLPTNAPGLLMLATGMVAGSELWAEKALGIMRPDRHTRISAVFVFETFHHQEGGKFRWGAASRAVENVHGRNPLPEWLRSAIGLVE
jgi:hypothetical protein